MCFRPKLALISYLLTAVCCQVQCFTPSAWADLLAGTAFGGAVLRLNEDDGSLLPGGVAPGSAGLSFVSGVTVGPDGNIYVSSRGGGEVLFYDGDTGFPLPSPHAGGRTGLFATIRTPNTPMSDPGPLRFGPDGNLYVADFGGSAVWRINGTTGNPINFVNTAGSGPLAGITFGPDGDLYVGDFNNAMVTHIDNGAPTIFITSQSGGLLTPSSLLFLPDGDLLVVDLFGNKILRYDENGQNPSTFAVIPPEITFPLPPGTTVPSNNPSDITFDSDGNIVLAVLGLTNPPDNRGALLRYNTQGALLETILQGQTPLGSIARIAPTTFLFGDYDRNGSVQMADYTKWRSDFGIAVSPNGVGADGNGDGVVDAADYAVWRNAFGGGLAAGELAVVPEPATVFLLVGGAACACLARKRRSSRRPRC